MAYKKVRGCVGEKKVVDSRWVPLLKDNMGVPEGPPPP